MHVAVNYPRGKDQESRHCVLTDDGLLLLYEDYLDLRIDELERRVEALESA